MEVISFRYNLVSVGGNLSQITKSEAESKGLEPCKKCY